MPKMQSDDWSGIRHFKQWEFPNPGQMDDQLILRLDKLRDLAGVPIYITSSYRDGDPKSHGKGLAVDISDNLEGKDLNSHWRFAILSVIFSNGMFRRVGIYDRHIHVDLWLDAPQEVAWWKASS